MKYYLFFVIVIISIGCGDPEVINYRLSDFEKSFVFFKPGTYWIFQNDSSMLIDSLYVTDISDHVDPGKMEDGDLYDTKEVNGCYIKKALFPQSDVLLRAKAIEGGLYTVSKEWIVFFNFENNEIKNAIKHDTMHLNGVLYNNVFEVKQFYYAPTYLFDTAIVFLASSIGVIKWEVHYPDSIHDNWSLIRYHIQ